MLSAPLARKTLARSFAGNARRAMVNGRVPRVSPALRAPGFAGTACPGFRRHCVPRVSPALRAPGFAGTACPGFRRHCVPQVSPLRGYNPGYDGGVVVVVVV